MKIKLWSIQDEKGWNELQDKGVLITKEEFVWPDYKNGYDWLKVQMINRIGSPSKTSQYPVWAWFQSMDDLHKKPDLRRSGYLPRGETGYRIEIEKEEKDVLLSDFELWHTPLAYKSFIANSEKEQLEFEAELKNKYGTNIFLDLPERVKKQIEKSWEKIFDMDFDVEYFAKPSNKKQIQATFWELNLEEIVKIGKFKAR